MKRVIFIIFLSLGILFLAYLYTDLRGELSRTRLNLEDMRNELSLTKKTLEEREAELEDTKLNLKKTEAELGEKEKEIKALKLDLKKKEDELSLIKKTLKEREAELEDTKLSLKMKEEEIKTLKLNLEDALREIEELKAFAREEYRRGLEEGFGHGYTIRDPTYEEMVDFIRKDRTDEREYIEGKYECRHFARDVCNNAEDEGIRCALVLVDFEEGSHAIVGFNTVDKGFVYIEPQTDEEVEIEVGKKYMGLTVKGVLIIW